MTRWMTGASGKLGGQTSGGAFTALALLYQLPMEPPCETTFVVTLDLQGHSAVAGALCGDLCIPGCGLARRLGICFGLVVVHLPVAPDLQRQQEQDGELPCPPSPESGCLLYISLSRYPSPPWFLLSAQHRGSHPSCHLHCRSFAFHR